MRVLFDTNVVLDVLLQRTPFFGSAAQLFAKVETGVLNGYLCATTITTIHYLATKELDKDQARKEIDRLLMLFDVAPVNRGVLASAVRSPISDYEDAVLHEAARSLGLDAIITRNIGDFKQATLTVHTPDELLGVLEVS